MNRYSATTRAAMAEYRELLAQQARLADEQKWTMGAAIRAAKMRAYVEMELDEHGLRRS